MAKKILRALFVLLILAGIGYIYYKIAGEIIELRRLGEDGNPDAIKGYLKSFGWKGAVVIGVIQMLQMVVAVIPAEFVQISAGIAYPYYYALAICVAGVVLGATVIFVVVRALNIRMASLEKHTKRIGEIAQNLNKKTSITLLMYLLFLTPIITHGAVCYFAATSKISYRRYICVCATGVIPSITVSYAMGNIVHSSIGKNTGEFIATVIVAAVLMILLLLLLGYISKRVLMRGKPLRPNALLYYPLFWGFSLFYKLKNKLVNKAKELKKIKGPALILSTHPTAYDFYYAAYAVYPKRITVVANRYYTEVNPAAGILKYMKVIPKSPFTKDIETIKKIMSAVKKGHILVMMPEGRMSPAGENLRVADGTAELVRKLDIDVYKLNTEGAFYGKPKWAPRMRGTRLEITAKKLFSAGELGRISLERVRETLDGELAYQSRALSKVACRDLTEGLDGVLYLCPHCGSEFSLDAQKNAVTCTSCGMTVVMDKYCNFTAGPFTTIAEWYNSQSERIRDTLGQVSLTAAVTVMKTDKKKKRMYTAGSGICALDKERFTFEGEISGKAEAMDIPLETLEAMPFSAGEEFELYHNGELYYFYPVENPNQCVKWSMVVDEVTKLRKSE